LTSDPLRRHAIPSAYHDPDPPIRIRDLFSAIAGGWYLVLGSLALMIALAILTNRLLVDRYEAETTLRVGSAGGPQSPLGNLAGFAGIDLFGGGDGIDTDLDVLRSRQIAETVVDSLFLHISLLEPRAPRDSVLRITGPGRDVPDGVYVLTAAGQGRYRLASENALLPQPAPVEISVGAPFRLGGASLVIEPGFAASAPPRIRFEVVPFDEAVEDFRDLVRVSQPNSRSQVVSIRYRTPDRLLAAEVPNVMAHRFIAHSIESSRSELHSTVEVLAMQVEDYRRQMEEALSRVSRYQEQQPMANLALGASTQASRLGSTHAQRDLLVLEQESLGKLLREIEEENPGTQTSVFRRLAAFPPFIANRAVQEILVRLIEMDTERANLLARRTPENDDVRTITQRVQELEGQLFTLAYNYFGSLESQIRSADQILAQFDGQLAAIPMREMELKRLELQAEMLGEVYGQLQQRLKEAEIQAAIERGEVRILDSAIPPRRAVSPRREVNLALGGVIGLLLGIVLAVGLRSMDPRLRTRDEAELVTGGVPVLGIIPPTATERRSAREVEGARSRIRLPGLTPRESGQIKSLAQGASAEAYRALSTRIARADPAGAPGVILLTSADSGDGRAITARNLALAFAERGLRTVLVDAEFRGISLTSLLGMRELPGLTEALSGSLRPVAAARIVGIADAGFELHVIPAGQLSPQGGALLRPAALNRVVAELRREFDVVILTAAPLRLASATALLATVADAAILVARAGVTRKDDLRETTLQLAALGVDLLGIIMHESETPEDPSMEGYPLLSRTGEPVGPGV